MANTIKDFGLVPEVAYPLLYEDKYVEDYYSTPPKALDVLGEAFNERFKVNFEVFYLGNLREALRYAPVQVYVNAWYSEYGVYYNPTGKINHAVTGVTEEQILDTYKPYIKTLAKDYTYWETGYKYSVTEIINNMNVEQFLQNNDLLFVRNTQTGQFGRIMQMELKVVETDDRGTLLLLDEAVRMNGRGLSNEEWETLPKKNF